ncbi:MAG: hypothetical protein RRB13_03320 [bacterium]|nr:hypothetical protein [bacterium]
MERAVLEGLFSLRGKIELGLGPINRLLERMGRPDRDLNLIHLAGTNGKGSSLVGLEALLLASGYRTGAFISPHLVRFNERYRLDGLSASDAQVDAALAAVCDALGCRPEDLAQAQEKSLGASFFEISFAMALWLFKEQAVDWALIETGLGGRLDATNGLLGPKAVLITKIGLDHMDYLGADLRSIAREKLGIAKPGAPLFWARQEPGLDDLAQARADALGVPLIPVDPGLTQGMSLGLAGAHQAENLSSSLALYRHLCPPERRLSPAQEAQVLGQLSWPGRLEYVTPSLLLDGAHNAQGLAALLAHLKAQHRGQKILLGLGWMQGKNLLEGFDPMGLDLEYLPLVGSYYGAESDPESSLVPLGPTWAPKSPGEALKSWQEGEFKAFDLVVLAGSLYLLGQLKALMP